MPFWIRNTERFFGSMLRLRSLPKGRQQQIAQTAFAAIQPSLGSMDINDLRQLRRRCQDERALLIYEGAREFTDARYAAAILVEQWALARLELIEARSLVTEILAERRRKAIEDFVRDNLPE
jgi:hypothetical protein